MTQLGNVGERRKRVNLFMAIPYLTGAALLVSQVIADDWKLNDAYITFAYARKWEEGHGIVFNIGERVEGYTVFSGWCCPRSACGSDFSSNRGAPRSARPSGWAQYGLVLGWPGNFCQAVSAHSPQ